MIGSAHPDRIGAERSAIKNSLRKLVDNFDDLVYILNEPSVGYRMAEGEPQGLEER